MGFLGYSMSLHIKKSLRIPKGSSEAVNQRSDNTMAKSKKNKRTNNETVIYKTLDRKLKIKQHEPHKKQKVNSGAPER
jgi:hypothetical protein